jgi:tellurite resistance protein
MLKAEDLAHIIPNETELTDAQRSAVLEIAAMAAAVDRAIHRAEIASIERVAAKLGKPIDAEIGSLFKRLTSKSNEDETRERLKSAAARLDSDPARELAYKVAYGITVADLDDDARESAYMTELATALGLAEEATSQLEAAVKDLLKKDQAAT